MMKAFVNRIWILCLLLGPVAGADMPSMIFTAGTPVTGRDGADWAFVVWRAAEADLLEDRMVAVYGKEGEADAPQLYTRMSVGTLQTDPRAIQSLLLRAERMGDDLALLEDRVDALFEEILPPGAYTLAEKIAVCTMGAMADSRQHNNLRLLARLHPAVHLVLGEAFALRMSAPVMTFEVRDLDRARDVTRGVLGRVTVSAEAEPLPPPGAPVRVEVTDSRGDLNVRLRWAKPDELRRNAPMLSGYTVFRLTQQLADAEVFSKGLPDRAAFLDLVAAHPEAVRVNRLPVVPPRALTAAEAEDPADDTTFFIADDNNRAEGGIAFEDGDRYYYFVAARDIAGREGAVSAGTAVTVCRRMPPVPPQRLRVENEPAYDITEGARSYLRLSWEQLPDGEATAYHVYRWLSPDEAIAAAAAHPGSGVPLTNRIAGPLPHLPGRAENHYTDSGEGAPALPDDDGLTFWYTVRAEKAGACGPLVSGNSAPAWGVLRKVDGPEAPDGEVIVSCFDGVVSFTGFDAVPDARVDRQRLSLRLVCETEESGFLWAEFYGAGGAFLGAGEFSAGGGAVVLDLAVTGEEILSRGDDSSIVAPAPSGLFVSCRVVSMDGLVSEFTPSTNLLEAGYTLGEPIRLQVAFSAELVMRSGADCSGRHSARDPRDGTVVFPEIVFTPTEGSREYRIYRRIDNGPFTLIAQGAIEDPDAPITFTDEAMPTAGGTICYYAQLFDEHGNPSPLRRLDCIEAGGVQDLAQPLLAPPAATGDDESRGMELTWFCPPAGVERFEVLLAQDGRPEGEGVLPDLRVRRVVPAGSAHEFAVLETPDVDAFAEGPLGRFTWTLPVGEGRYTVAVRAVGRGPRTAGLEGRVTRPRGPISNIEQFVWLSSLTEPFAEVPWPARPMPPVDETFLPELQAYVFPLSYLTAQAGLGTAIRIGDLDETAYFDGERSYIDEAGNPLRFLYRAADRLDDPREPSALRSVFPCVLYRQQIPTARVPVVSGNWVQVSPLMEQIAHEQIPDPGSGVLPHTIIHDPFIAVIPREVFGEEEGRENFLCVLDRHPVISGAMYRYVLVRFRPDGEIDRVIPTNSVEIP